MSFLLDIINGLNKFLGYLDISPKYLNRGYTILSIIPTIYILRIVYGLWINQNYVQFALYTLVFIALLYFVVLNFFYYFLDKNLKVDVTQLFVKYLPDDAFNIQDTAKGGKIDLKDTKEIAVDYDLDYQLKLANNIKQMIKEKEIPTNDLSKRDGFLVNKNTLYPYYFLKPVAEGQYSLQIGRSYDQLEEVGRVKTKTQAKVQPIGLFISGGDFVKGGTRYHEPYHLKLMVKKGRPEKNQSAEVATGEMSRASRRSKRK